MLKYEIVKALKEAGFPLKQTPSQDYPQLATDLIIDHVRYQYPTLSELIEACGKNIGFVKGEKLSTAWCFDKIDSQVICETPEEAFANLYLEVHKV